MVASLGLGNGKLREFKVLFWEIMLLADKAIFIYSLVHRMTVHTRESCSCSPAALPISVVGNKSSYVGQ